MPSGNCWFCRSQLRLAREMAKENGVKVPKKLEAGFDDSGVNRFYYVDSYHHDKPGVVWQGAACCSYEAKAKTIEHLIGGEGFLS